MDSLALSMQVPDEGLYTRRGNMSKELSPFDPSLEHHNLVISEKNGSNKSNKIPNPIS